MSRETLGRSTPHAPRLPEPLRAQLVEQLAQLLVADLERHPTLTEQEAGVLTTDAATCRGLPHTGASAP